MNSHKNMQLNIYPKTTTLKHTILNQNISDNNTTTQRKHRTVSDTCNSSSFCIVSSPRGESIEFDSPNRAEILNEKAENVRQSERGFVLKVSLGSRLPPQE